VGGLSHRGGVIYLLLFVYGLLIDHNSAAIFVSATMPIIYLHLVLAVYPRGNGGPL